jgi:hypothetical protein
MGACQHAGVEPSLGYRNCRLIPIGGDIDTARPMMDIWKLPLSATFKLVPFVPLSLNPGAEDR